MLEVCWGPLRFILGIPDQKEALAVLPFRPQASGGLCLSCNSEICSVPKYHVRWVWHTLTAVADQPVEAARWINMYQDVSSRTAH